METSLLANIQSLILRCHRASAANGWWEPKPDREQQLMLVVSELAEALEAQRTNKELSGLRAYEGLLAEAKREGPPCWGEATTLEERRQQLFKWKVKDTVADELADAYIRLCDFAGGFELQSHNVEMQRHVFKRDHAETAPQNFGAALLRITAIVAASGGTRRTSQEMAVGYALGAIEFLCERMDIDLDTHIDLKLSYNATRGVKHSGKLF